MTYNRGRHTLLFCLIERSRIRWR